MLFFLVKKAFPFLDGKKRKPRGSWQTEITVGGRAVWIGYNIWGVQSCFNLFATLFNKWCEPDSESGGGVEGVGAGQLPAGADRCLWRRFAGRMMRLFSPPSGRWGGYSIIPYAPLQSVPTGSCPASCFLGGMWPHPSPRQKHCGRRSWVPHFVSRPRSELQEIRNWKIHLILTRDKTRKCQVVVSLCRTELVEISRGKVRIWEAVGFSVISDALLFPTATRSRCFSLQQHEAAPRVQRREAASISGARRASGGISQVL